MGRRCPQQHVVQDGGDSEDEEHNGLPAFPVLEEVYDQQDGADPQVVAPALLDFHTGGFANLARRGAGPGYRGSGRVGLRRNVVPPPEQARHVHPGEVPCPAVVPQPQPAAAAPSPVQPGRAGASGTPVRQAALLAAAQQAAGLAGRDYPPPLLPSHAPGLVQNPVTGPALPCQDTSQPVVSQELPLPSPQELPSLTEVHRTYVPTVTWVPKGARPEFTRVFTSQCNRVAYNPDNISAWILQLMFAKSILPAVKHRPDTNQAKTVKERLERWRRGEYRALWEEAVTMTKLKGRSRKKGQEQQLSQEEKNAQRATRLAQQGEYTRACQALVSAGLADQTPSTIRDMKAKHPSPQTPTTFQTQDNTPQLTFTKEQVTKAIKSFKRGSVGNILSMSSCMASTAPLSGRTV